MWVQNVKKWYWCLLISCFCLTGCGNNVEQKTSCEMLDCMQYELEYENFSPIVEIFHDEIYYSTNGRDLHTSDIQGQNQKEILALPEECGYIVDVYKAEKLKVLTKVLEDEELQYHVLDIENGGVSKDVIMEELENHSVTDFLANGENFYILTGDGKIKVYSMDGKCKADIEIESPHLSMCMLAGDIIVGQTRNEQMKISCLSQDNFTLETLATVKVNDMGANVRIISDEQELCYVVDANYVYEYRANKKALIPLFDWTAVGVEGNTVSKIFLRNDGSLLLVFSTPYGSRVSVKKIVLTDKENVAAKEELVLAGVNVDRLMKEKVIEFNKTNEDYRIVIKDYSTEEAPYTALSMDIISNDSLDILCLTEMPVDVFVQKGLLADLSGYMDETQYVEAYIQAISSDGAICQVAPAFAIYTLMGRQSEVGEEVGWTFDEFKQCVKEDMEIKSNALSYDLQRILCHRQINEFIDWEKKTVHFQSKEFGEILEFIREYSYSLDNQMPYFEKLRSGKVLLAEVYLTSGNNYRTYKHVFCENICAKGFPGSSQANFMSLISPMGINSKSSYKEVAWEFISGLLTEEVEYEYRDYGFPTRLSTLERLIDQWKGEEQVPEAEITLELGGKREKVPYMNGEDVDVLWQIIASANLLLEDHSEIAQIINEELGGYLAGQISLEKIQDRVGVLVSEF